MNVVIAWSRASVPGRPGRSLGVKASAWISIFVFGIGWAAQT